MRGVLLLVICAAVAGGVATAGTLRPGITLNWRIGAVHYAERKNRVDAALGRSNVKRLDRYNGRWIFYPRHRIYILYSPAHRGLKYAVAIATHSSGYKTRSGIGVGSSLRQLRHRVKVTCHLADGECQTTPADINHPFTDFHIDGTPKRVTEVDIFPGGD